MDLSIEKEEGENMFYVDVGEVRIFTTWAAHESDITNWIHEVSKIYRTKGRPRKNQLLLALVADRWYIEKYKKKEEKQPFHTLQLCIGVHCLLAELEIWNIWNPKSLRNFLNGFGIKVVGVGIEETVKKLEKCHGWVMPPVIELRELAEKNEEVIKKIKENSEETSKVDLSKHKIAKLAKLVLGEETSFVKPTDLQWWSPDDNDRLSEEKVMYATLETFLVSQMGVKLLRTTSPLSATVAQAFFFQGSGLIINIQNYLSV
ncbi:hypothetical protein UlMin_035878 [Ulmus minor]